MAESRLPAATTLSAACAADAALATSAIIATSGPTKACTRNIAAGAIESMSALPHLRTQVGPSANVREGPGADICNATNRSLFDHFVGSCQRHGRHACSA